MSRHAPRLGRGHRLADERDPLVRAALKRPCPDCDAQPDQWCVGIAENSRTKGRRLSRIHFARAGFADTDITVRSAGRE